MIFGERLKKLRENKGIFQRDLAELLGVNTSTIAKYETSKRHPDFDSLKTLADYFGVSIDYLIGYNDNPIPLMYEQMPPGSIESLMEFCETTSLNEMLIKSHAKLHSYMSEEFKNKPSLEEALSNEKFSFLKRWSSKKAQQVIDYVYSNHAYCEDDLEINASKNRIPVFNFIPDGDPLNKPEIVIEYLEFPKKYAGKDSFVIKISESFIKTSMFCEEDYVVIKKTNQEPFPGQSILARVNGIITIKRFYPLGDKVRLEPVENNEPPLDKNSIDIIGIVTFMGRPMI